MTGWIFSCFCFSVYLYSVHALTQCTAGIHFPTQTIDLNVTTSPVKVKVNFTVTADCLDTVGDYRLDIYAAEGIKRDISVSDSGHLCTIRPDQHKEKCGCEKTDKRWSCYAEEDFPRRKHRIWLVKAENPINISNNIVVFNVTYPTSIEYFTFNQRDSLEVDQNRKVGLLCEINWGIPQKPVQLLGPQDTVLRTRDPNKNSNTRFTHYVTARCSSSGQFRCQVEGTDEFKSATLLVRCPLAFETKSASQLQTVQRGKDATVSFNVISYTTVVITCQLSSPANERDISCDSTKSKVDVRGSPPHLVITVIVRNVSAEDDGTWRLTAGNPKGDNSITFVLSVTGRTPEEPQSSGAEGDCVSYFELAVGACAVLAVSLMVLVVILICLWRKGWKLPCAESSNGNNPSVRPVSSDGEYLEPLPRRVDPDDCPQPRPALGGRDRQEAGRGAGGRDRQEAGRGLEEHVYQEAETPLEGDDDHQEQQPRLEGDDDYLEPQPRLGAHAGPYESLQMADVGQRSVYSQITPRANVAAAGVTFPSETAEKKGKKVKSKRSHRV